MLALIRRNVPNNSALQVEQPHRMYHPSMDELGDVEPVRSDGEVIGVKPIFVSSAQMFTTIDPDTLRLAQMRAFESYFKCFEGPKTPLPSNETVPFMYYFNQDDLLFRPYTPGRLRKHSTFLDQLVMPHALIGVVLNAFHADAMHGGYLACKSRLTRFGRGSGGLPCIAT